MLWESVQRDKVWTEKNNLKALPNRPQLRELISEATLNWRYKYWSSWNKLEQPFFCHSSSKPGHSPSLEGGRWSLGDDHQSFSWKEKNGSRSLETKGESTRKGPANAGQLERISWHTSVWEANKGAPWARQRTYWLREVPTSSLCASLAWLLSYSEARSLPLLL